LILVGSVLPGHPWGPEITGTLGSCFRLGAEGRLDEAKAVWLAGPLFFSSHRIPAVAARLEQMIADYGCWELQNELPHLPLDPPAIDRLPEIAAPTLVIVGEQDLPDFHQIAERFAAEIPGARTVVLPDAGHLANMDAPDAFNRVLLDFLESVGPTSEASRDARPAVG
jgi:pimeloyl-ACP methyl ester carboxylesterase